MPEDEMPPQAPPESQRPLEIDGIAGLEPAERRPRERLGSELEDELVRPALDPRQARAVHGDARAEFGARERRARLHAEPERGAGARQRDEGPHFLDDPGEHLFDAGGSGVAPPDHPPPAPQDGRIRTSIAPASPALESRFVWHTLTPLVAHGITSASTRMSSPIGVTMSGPSLTPLFSSRPAPPTTEGAVRPPTSNGATKTATRSTIPASRKAAWTSPPPSTRTPCTSRAKSSPSRKPRSTRPAREVQEIGRAHV